jgi:hypothetical protein
MNLPGNTGIEASDIGVMFSSRMILNLFSSLMMAEGGYGEEGKSDSSLLQYKLGFL